MRAQGRWWSVLGLVAWLVSAMSLGGGRLLAQEGVGKTLELRFDPDAIRFEHIGEFERVFLRGLEVVAQPGEPSLPCRIVSVLVPGEWEGLSIEAEPGEFQNLGSGHRVFPRQKPQVLSLGAHKTVAFPLQTGVASIYESDGPFPSFPARVVRVKALKERTLVTAVVCPFRYWPKSGRLEIAKDVKVRFFGTKEAKQLSYKLQNAEVARWLADYKLTEAGTRQESASIRDLPFAEYVVVTSESFVPTFEPLVRWKNEKGVTAKAVSVEWIYRNFAGFDHQEQIREFLKFARREWGTRWVLLGGDVWTVPMRYAFAMDCEANYADNENNIPCDLYFSDLDGSWEANGNGVFGEVDDGVDGFPDVYVGRAPVQTYDEVRTFVWKDSVYERAPDPRTVLKMLFLGEVLWNNPYTDSGEGKNLIDLLYVPERFDPITKLYESLGNESVEAVVEALNSGYNFVNHDGHAWYTVMGVGQGYLRRSDVQGLTNGSRLPLVYSIGCWPAAFDLECIAEDFVNNPNGGAVAFIGNSRYGWGSPGNPHFGYSDRFDQQFYRFVFQENVVEVGRALALAKAYYMPFARQENVYRWCEYEINLLGDPELPLWTDVPAELSVHHPDTISAGATSVEVLVSADGKPCSGARVAVSQGGKLLGIAFTDAAGFASVPVDSLEPGVTGKVVVTGRNLLPYEGRVVVTTADAYLAVAGSRVEDEVADGLLNPGTSSELWFLVRNSGREGSPVGTISLASQTPWLNVTSGRAEVRALNPGDSSWVGPFAVAVEDTVQDGARASVVLEMPGRDVRVAIPVGWPRVRVFLAGINGKNGRIDPGENGEFVFGLSNDGLGAACDVRVRFQSLDRALQIEEGPVTCCGGSCLASGNTVNVGAAVSVGASAPSPWFPLVEVTVEANGGRFRSCDTVQVTVGRTGFVDSCSALSRWDETLSQLDTLSWQLTEARFHSAPSAFYCGNARTREYVAGMADSLVTLPFTVGQSAKLTFWCWYDVAIYGVDGLYVRVLLPDGSWKTLDFIGSGGALPGKLMGNDWLPYVYDLSFLTPGSQTRLCFKFVSDGDTQAEGVYIDDIEVVSGVEHSVATEVAGAEADDLPERFELTAPYPNPFNSSVRVGLIVPKAGNVRLVVYDMLGRRVVTLLNGQLQVGKHTVTWRGTDSRGDSVPSGVYVVRAWSPDAGWFATRKVVLLR